MIKHFCDKCDKEIKSGGNKTWTKGLRVNLLHFESIALEKYEGQRISASKELCQECAEKLCLFLGIDPKTELGILF